MRLALSVTVFALAVAAATPSMAQTDEELRQQLEAQRALNDQLRERVQELERRLSGVPAAPALRPVERPLAAAEPESAEATTAIESALIAKGLVLLPPGSLRLSPGVSWMHAGSDAIRTRSDTYSANLTVQAGLPLGAMLSATVPYVKRDTSLGTNSGLGNVSVGVNKKLNNESERFPSLVAGLNYSHDSGKGAFEPVSIGSGFRSLGASLSALKRIEPVALYGGLAYTHVYARDVSADNLFGLTPFVGNIAPGAAWSYRLGTSLSATPEITLDASVAGSFVRAGEVRVESGGSATLPKSTIAFLNLGAGFILTRQASLLLSAAAGTTKDSPDFIFTTSLAYRL
jgi:hypothetical protein